MWIFFLGGFVSAVVHRHDSSRVIVRAREREHLEGFLDREPGTHETRHIKETPGADYRYRAIMPRVQFARTLSTIALSMEATNFKDSVAEAGAPRRWLSVLSKVWTVLWNFQETNHARP